jgi:hypothetical protein
MVLLAGLLVVGWAGAAQAQVTTGGIAGQVVDKAQGGALPGATVSVVHVPTNATVTLTTDAQGRFVLPNARPGGPYTVRAALEGFQSAEQNEVTIGLGRTTEVELALDLEQVSEEITVTGTAEELINPNRTGSESLVSVDEIEAFPTVRRNLLDVARTNPYASIRPGDDNQKDISFAGRSNKYNNIQIDGSNYNDLFGLGESGGTPAGQTNSQPIQLDALQELQVSVSPYDVRQGGFTGGAINAVTKSGTNEFHGSAYYAERDPDYVGDGPSDIPVKNFDEEQFGASFGGRIVPDKLFFFVAGESNDKTEPSGVSADGSTGTQFGKPADAARFQSILQTKYGYDPGGLGDIAIATESEHVFARLDWNAASNHNLTFRYNFIDAFRDDVANRSRTVFRFPKATFSRDAEIDSTVVQLNSILGSAFNEARIGYQELLDIRSFPEAFPSVEVGGTGPRRGELLGGTEQFSGLNRIEQEVLELHDDVTFLQGDHTVTIGTHNEFFTFKNFFLASFFGYYYFPTLDALDKGLATEYQISFANGTNPAAPISDFGVSQWGLYAGDQWRVNDRLTFSYGLRGDLAKFDDDPDHNPLVLSALGIDTSDVPDDNLIVSPRIGFNWDPRGKGEDQVRGGIGIFAGRTPYVWISNVYAGTGVVSTALTLRGSIPFNPDPFSQPHSGVGGTPTVDVIDPDFEFPQVLRGTIAYDRSLPWWDLRATVELIHSQVEEEIYYVNANRVQTGTNALDGRPTYARKSTAINDAPLLTNTGEGEETVASIVVSRPARGGVGLNAGYAWMDAESAFEGGSSRAISNWQFWPVRGDIFRPEASTSGFETEHRFWANANYSFDTGPVTHELGLFYSAESGRPYSVLMGGDPNKDGFSTNDLLYVPQAGQVIFQGFTAEQFQAYLSFHGLGGPGIVARNASRAPWSRRLDFHYGLGLPISKVRAQVTVDLLNVWNLIDSDEHISEFVAFGTTTPITTSVDSATGKTIYRENFPGAITNPASAFSTSDTLSRWQARLGLRLSF